MNIEEYISSGVLEAYVLDELSTGERLEVEQMAASHPEVREELNRIEASIENLAFKTAINPGEDLKDKIKSRMEGEGKQITFPETAGPSPLLRYAVAASVTVALITSYLAFNYWDLWQSAEQRLSDLIAQNSRMAEDYNRVNQRLESIETDLNILSDPDFDRITMKGTDNSPESIATIYWNTVNREVYLDIQDLKELSQQNQYQLWAIVEGQPVDIGVFDLSDQLIKMESIADASAFAVTIEPRGGSATPSLETMQVLGAVEG